MPFSEYFCVLSFISRHSFSMLPNTHTLCLFLDSTCSVSSRDAQIFCGVQVHLKAANLQLHILLGEQDYRSAVLLGSFMPFDGTVVEFHPEN